MTHPYLVPAESDSPRARELAARKRYDSDTESHSLRILHDDGVYRHLSFSNNGSSMYRFDIVTWPGHLAVTGDMGDLTFRRIDDMVDFFDQPGINAQYWAEKIVSSGFKVREYDQAELRIILADRFKDYVEEAAGADDIAAVEFALVDLINDAEDEDTAHFALSEFREIRGFALEDTWEWDLTRYSGHYLWLLWAIVDGLAQYRTVKVASAAQSDAPLTNADLDKLAGDYPELNAAFRSGPFERMGGWSQAIAPQGREEIRRLLAEAARARR